MDDLPARARDLSGGLAVAVAALAVCLVVLSVVIDNKALLGLAAVIAVLAALVVMLRRSAFGPVAGSKPASSGAQPPSDTVSVTPARSPADETTGAVLPRTEDAGEPDTGAELNRDDADESSRYQAAAIDARTQLIEAMRKAPVFADASSRSEDDPGHPPTPGGEPRDRLTDPITGLFSQEFFEASLPKRVAAARRGLRPLAVAMVEVARTPTSEGSVASERHAVASTMQSVFRDSDTLAAADDGKFLLLFEDTPEAGAVWTLERLRRQLAAELPDHILWAGISCYPAHAFDGPGLVRQARHALVGALEWKQGRIEVSADQTE